MSDEREISWIETENMLHRMAIRTKYPMVKALIHAAMRVLSEAKEAETKLNVMHQIEEDGQP